MIQIFSKIWIYTFSILAITAFIHACYINRQFRAIIIYIAILFALVGITFFAVIHL